MQQLFAKIDLEFPWAVRSRRGEPTTSYTPISYYKVAGYPFPFKLLKAWEPDIIRWVEIVGEGIAGPHRDHGIVTSLNLYMETSAETTHFWEPKDGAIPYRHANATTDNVFASKDLKLRESFIAKNGDAYLLDVSQIHSVERTDESIRRFIQLSWNTTPFGEVLDRIRKS